MDRYSSQLDRIENTLGDHTKQLGDINSTLLRNTITVEQHERRSTLLEDEFKVNDKRVEVLEDQFDRAKAILNFIMWFFGTSATLATIAGVVYEILMKKAG